MLANFTEETCTGTGATLVLTGITTGNIAFSKSFADGDLVAYVLEDSGGTIKVAGIGTYVSATDDITRNDTWNWNGTVIDNNPSTNITLGGGTHTVRCDIYNDAVGGIQPIAAHYEDSSHKSSPNNWVVTTSAGTLTANRMPFVPALLLYPTVVNNLSLRVSTADGSSPLSIAGIYSCGMDSLPDKLLCSAAMPVGTTGLKSVTIGTAITLPKGWYFFVYATDSSSVGINRVDIQDLISTPYGSNMGIPRNRRPYETLASWSALPATASISGWDENYGARVSWD